MKRREAGPDSAVAVKTLKIVKDWYRARSAEGTTTKNINSMSVLYSVACLMELEETEGGVFTAEEKEEYLGWMHEWAEWAMHDLPSESEVIRRLGLQD